MGKKSGSSELQPLGAYDSSLPAAARHAVLYGSDGKKIAYDVKRDSSRYQFEHAFEGVVPNLLRRYKETKSDMAREETTRRASRATRSGS